MEYVSLGRGGPTVSAVGLGMWQAGGKAWGADVRDADCRKAMERAVDLGINLVDTAEAYGDGHSEQVMSRAIKDVGRDRVFIATKVGGWHLRADDVKKACAGSLKRLGVREIDLYQVHWPDPWSQVPLREPIKALQALPRAGSARLAPPPPKRRSDSGREAPLAIARERGRRGLVAQCPRTSDARRGSGPDPD